MAGKLRIKQIRSIIGRPEKHKRIIKALGLKKMHMTVEHEAKPEIVGMIRKVPHLVQVEEV
ncbi:MAG: 50S ribosomal protein L30 [Desulfobacteraceae bacterium]